MRFACGLLTVAVLVFALAADSRAAIRAQSQFVNQN
jgi:hypothetical protein